eukprot:6191311-Pleurochrysis_carterae.AAC.1
MASSEGPPSRQVLPLDKAELHPPFRTHSAKPDKDGAECGRARSSRSLCQLTSLVLEIRICRAAPCRLASLATQSVIGMADASCSSQAMANKFELIFSHLPSCARSDAAAICEDTSSDTTGLRACGPEVADISRPSSASDSVNVFCSSGSWLAQSMLAIVACFSQVRRHTGTQPRASLVEADARSGGGTANFLSGATTHSLAADASGQLVARAGGHASSTIRCADCCGSSRVSSTSPRASHTQTPPCAAHESTCFPLRVARTALTAEEWIPAPVVTVSRSADVDEPLNGAADIPPAACDFEVLDGSVDPHADAQRR